MTNRNVRALTGYLSNYARGEFDHPFYASFKITHRCNLRCAFCNVWADKMPDLHTSDVYSIIDNLSRSSTFTISFEGGEPLLRKDIGEVLRYTHDCSNYILFTTNGLLIDKRPFEEYARYFDFLELSIDEGHGNVHLLDRLDYFSDLGIKTTVQTVVTKHDLATIEQKVEKVHEHGHKILIMPAFAFEGTEDLTPDLMELRAIIAQLKRRYGTTLTTSSSYIQSFDAPYTCRTLSIMIEPNGDLIYPCMPIGAKLGNLLDSDLRALMTSERAKADRQKMLGCDKHCLIYCHAESSHLMSLRKLVPYARNIVGFRLFG
ncbi:MAG: radical SAM protein [Halobacteriota archaeon]